MNSVDQVTKKPNLYFFLIIIIVIFNPDVVWSKGSGAAGEEICAVIAD